MQNTIVKEFEGNPDVVTLLFNEGVVLDETYSWMKTFWDNVYLRGTVVHDSLWAYSGEYRQPNTNLPFGRGFIIDRDGTVALPFFGHKPQLAIDAIYALLEGTSVDGDDTVTGGISLSQNWPNPFNPVTNVSYALDVPGEASVRVVDIAGRHVTTLASGRHEAGEHLARWDGRSAAGHRVASGVYLVRLETARGVLARKMVMVR
jgi:hypothetical protein